MAVARLRTDSLRPEDFEKVRMLLRADDRLQRAYVQSGFSKDQWRAAIQALDTWFESQRPAAKTAMEAAVGAPISDVLAERLTTMWLAWKREQ